MSEKLVQIKTEIINIEINRANILSEISKIDLWLSLNKHSDKRDAKIKSKMLLTKELRLINVKLNTAIHDRSTIERGDEASKKLDAVKISRDQKDLLFQCHTVFSNMEKRGIGFDIRERNILNKLKDFIMQI